MLTKSEMMIGGAVALMLLLILLKKNGLVVDAAAGAVGVATDIVGGVVTGIGDAVGVPRTNESECQKALREGRTWDASFACPAGDFIGDALSRMGF